MPLVHPASHRGLSARTGARRRARGESAEQASAPRKAYDGSADFLAGLAELGLSQRTAWHASLLLWTIGGVSMVAGRVADPNAFSRDMLYAGIMSFAVAAFSLWGTLRRGDRTSRTEELLSHVRLSAGIVVIVYAMIGLGRERTAFALFPLTLIPSACFLLPWRAALPYPLAAVAIVLVGGLLTPQPAELAFTLVTAGVILGIAVALLVTKQRTRAFAVRNRRLAYTDPLTGIANVRSLRVRLVEELDGDDGAGGGPFALFAIDLDDFKRVNDTFDHTAGDRVLVAVAAALRDELAPDDLVARRGGDEFSVVVSHSGDRDLDGLKDRLEQAIARARISVCPKITPTGTAAYVQACPGEQLGALVARADDALRAAKLLARDGKARPRPHVETRAGVGEANGTVAPAAPTVVPHRSAEGEARAEWSGWRGPGRALVRATTRSQPDWRFAALALALLGAAIAALSAGGLVEPLSPAAGLAIAGAHIALAIGCLYAGLAGVSRRWLHLPWLATFGMVAAAVALAGRSGVALLDVLPGLAMYGFLTFGARTAALYVLLAQAAFAVLSLAGGFSHSVLRIVVTTIVVAEVGAVVAKLRLVTVQFARRNRELSELDELTGLANVRALRSRVARAVQRAAARGAKPRVRRAKHHPDGPSGLANAPRPVLVAIDLDQFKQVNDRHCHSTGDEVLVSVARALSDSVRADELVARRGGDEFAVVIEQGAAERCDVLLRRLHAAITAARNRTCPDVAPTATIAAVQWRTGESADQLLRRADIALHVTKTQRSPAAGAIA